MRLPRKNSPMLLHGECGFTLLEVVLGVIIIGAIGLGVVKAIDTNARSTRTLDEKVQATNLVTAYLEGIRQLSYDATANPYASVPDSISKPPQYDVAVTITYSPDGVYWYSTNSSGAYKLQKITISVMRDDGRQVLSTCTFKTTRIKQ